MLTPVDIRTTFRTIGSIVRWFSLTLIVPVGVALIYGDPTAPFWWTMLIGFVAGFALERPGPARDIGLREGFLVVGLGWLAVALVGGLPYVFEGGDIKSPIDAYFESMSGFTTTGSSVMAEHREPRPRDPVLALDDAVARAAWASSCSRSPCCRGSRAAAGR